MINGGVHPDAVFFNTIMGNLCKEGRVTEAKHFFDLMVHLGATPYVFFSYNTLINGYCLDGRMDKAITTKNREMFIGQKPTNICL
jgi:pentatricopeptide repeat protein